MEIRCERVYEWTPVDGVFPVLVDRLWPRGMKKEWLGWCFLGQGHRPHARASPRFSFGDARIRGVFAAIRGGTRAIGGERRTYRDCSRCRGLRDRAALCGEGRGTQPRSLVLADYLRALAG